MTQDIESGFNRFINHIQSGNIFSIIMTLNLEYLEMEDEMRMRPLHYACQHNQIEIVKLLLEHKCNVDVIDNRKMRPLHYACQNGLIEIVKLLLEHKCKMDVCNNVGKRPLHYAFSNNHVGIVKLLMDYKCNARDDIKMRPLHFACRNGQIESVISLLEQQCNIDDHDEYGMRPIHFACAQGNIKLIKLLLQHKSQIDKPDKDKMRPLHYACRYGHLKVVKLLLEHNCNIKDGYDNLVMLSKSQSIIDLLSAAKKNRAMFNAATAMSLKCKSGCSHSSCFISYSITKLKERGILIGNGAFGSIYKYVKIQRKFAMKLIKINPSQLIDKETKKIEENINEYRHVLKHENIVEYFGAVVESFEMMIFMEYVDGKSLQEQIGELGALPHDTIAKYTYAILLGIAYLHQNKIIHRDVKPANILLDSRNFIKLCDFGISRSLMTISTLSTQNANTFCGTPNYTAPEVINDKPYGYPADIWSVGATVIEMLTGYRPYHHMAPIAAIYKIGQTNKIEFTPVIPMSDNLNSFVKQMLESEPSMRATAEDLLKHKFLNS